MKKLFSCLFFTACFFFCAEVSYACTCVPPRPEFVKDAGKYVNYERDKAGNVFSGKVLRIDVVKNSKGKPSGVIRVRFRVYKSWKGAETNSITVSTTNICCICGYPFKVGEEYLVYASESLRTSVCTRTKNLEDAAEDLEFLGEANVKSEAKKTVTRSQQRKPKS